MANTVQAICWWVDLPPTEKSVLNALADAANDDGITWIAVKSRRADKLDLMKKTGFRERAIQGALARLEAAGHLSRAENPGKGVTYAVHPNGQSPKQWAQNAAAGLSTAPHEMRGASDARQHLATDRPAGNAGKPSLTINLEGGRPRATVADILALGVTPEQWADFEAMRARRRSPLTPGAVHLAHKTLVRLASEGHAPGLVVEQSTLNGWAGLFELRGEYHGQRNDNPAAGGRPRNTMVGAAIDAAGAGPDRR